MGDLPVTLRTFKDPYSDMTREDLIRLVDHKDGMWREAVREKSVLEGRLNEVLAGQAEMQQSLSKVLATLAEQSALLAKITRLPFTMLTLCY